MSELTKYSDATSWYVVKEKNVVEVRVILPYKEGGYTYDVVKNNVCMPDVPYDGDVDEGKKLLMEAIYNSKNDYELTSFYWSWYNKLPLEMIGG